MSEETEVKQEGTVQGETAQQGPAKPEAKQKRRIESIKGLEDVVDTLTEDVVKALDIKEQKRRLLEKIRKLSVEEHELKEVVADLKTTRDKLQEDLQKKNENISILQTKTEHLKEDKARLSSDKMALMDQIKNLEIEKQQMSTSLEKTNDMLMKLRHQIETFDEEIRS